MNIFPRRLTTFLKKRNVLILKSRPVHAPNSFESFVGVRKIHDTSSIALLSHLQSRGIVRLKGDDAVPFLQGLVTNDVNKFLEKDVALLYSFMLNVQGRILYDLFIYDITGKKGSADTLLVDIPVQTTKEFMSILKKYKLRKKVDIADVSDEFQVWSQFSTKTKKRVEKSTTESTPDGTIVSCPDPRVAGFSNRLIRQAPHDSGDSVSESLYKEARYQWGLPEGVDDLPTGNCFPLESNGVFMNAINFQKGCYLGQELTARTHYTGVTRKRLMPLVFESTPPEIESDSTVKSEKGRNAGKFRGSQGSYGLGLIRLTYRNEELKLTDGNQGQIPLTTHVPHWWPEFES